MVFVWSFQLYGKLFRIVVRELYLRAFFIIQAVENLIVVQFGYMQNERMLKWKVKHSTPQTRAKKKSLFISILWQKVTSTNILFLALYHPCIVFICMLTLLCFYSMLMQRLSFSIHGIRCCSVSPIVPYKMNYTICHSTSSVSKRFMRSTMHTM